MTLQMRVIQLDPAFVRASPQKIGFKLGRERLGYTRTSPKPRFIIATPCLKGWKFPIVPLHTAPERCEIEHSGMLDEFRRARRIGRCQDFHQSRDPIPARQNPASFARRCFAPSAPITICARYAPPFVCTLTPASSRSMSTTASPSRNAIPRFTRDAC